MENPSVLVDKVSFGQSFCCVQSNPPFGGFLFFKVHCHIKSKVCSTGCPASRRADWNWYPAVIFLRFLAFLSIESLALNDCASHRWVPSISVCAPQKVSHEGMSFQPFGKSCVHLALRRHRARSQGRIQSPPCWWRRRMATAWSPMSFFHLAASAQRQPCVQPPSTGQFHWVRHCPSKDQPGKAAHPRRAERSTIPSFHVHEDAGVRNWPFTDQDHCRGNFWDVSATIQLCPLAGVTVQSNHADKMQERKRGTARSDVVKHRQGVQRDRLGV